MFISAFTMLRLSERGLADVQPELWKRGLLFGLFAAVELRVCAFVKQFIRPFIKCLRLAVLI